MTDTETDGPKTQATPEQLAARRATRSVARALARIEGEAGESDFKARFEEKKTEYTNQARKLVRALTKEGISLAVSEGEEKGKGKGKGGGKGRKAAAAAAAADTAED